MRHARHQSVKDVSVVVARRLSEDPKIKVLVVEAGGRYFIDFILLIFVLNASTVCFALASSSDQGVLDAMVPFLGVKLTNTPLDWNFTTTPQAGLSGRVIPFARGHGLGGSSTISEYIAP